MQVILEILESSFQKGRNFLATRHADEKAASCVGHLDHLVWRLLNELLHLFRVWNLRRQRGSLQEYQRDRHLVGRNASAKVQDRRIHYRQPARRPNPNG
jgi:hypothetical protein